MLFFSNSKFHGGFKNTKIPESFVDRVSESSIEDLKTDLSARVMFLLGGNNFGMVEKLLNPLNGLIRAFSNFQIHKDKILNSPQMI